ncbi:unnamed protein product [Moneuplotes crassus]|uniref:Uncharacterized protein n=1 Tax=Euplotes crassus TaxID=5936 RepID=A0AAD1Y8X4_EUPCR|nr:unnamed protein product [Moneuplotes crassus]
MSVAREHTNPMNANMTPKKEEKEEKSSTTDNNESEHAQNLESLNEVIRKWEQANVGNPKEGLQGLLDKVENHLLSAKKSSQRGSSQKKQKPVDLYQTILGNIDKYSYLCDNQFAGPITKHKILDPLYEKKEDNCNVTEKLSQSSAKEALKLAVTVPKGPSFKTDLRLKLREDSNVRSSEELELERIQELKSLLQKQKKSNKNTIKALQEYQKPVMKKKQNTTVKEFKLSTDQRSSKHSEFRKQNMEKIAQNEAARKLNEKNEQKEQEEKAKKLLSYYNKSSALKPQEKEQSEKFVSLQNQISNALFRTDSEELPNFESPTKKKIVRHLTTPKSPPLSVKKRGEFTEKAKNLKSTEEIQLEDIEKNKFQALPMPTKIFDEYKPVTGNTPSGKKTTFKEFNLSQIKKKQLLTTDELELLNNPKEFRALEFNPKMFEKKVCEILSEKPVVQKTVPQEFNLKTTARKRDKKAMEKEMEMSQTSSKKRRYAKPNAPPCLSTSRRSRPVRVEKINNNFKAQPIPDYSKLAAEYECKRKISKPALTRPKGFRLSTDSRMRKSKIVTELLEEENKRNKKEFKATKAPKFDKVSKIKPSVKAPTKGKAPVFASESRVQLRKERELKRKMEEEIKEVSIQDPTEFEVTIKSSPEVRLKKEEEFEDNDNESVVYMGSNPP